MSDDEDRTPMTRTELAMLWDGLGRWLDTHDVEHLDPLAIAGLLRDHIDAELTRRFGG